MIISYIRTLVWGQGRERMAFRAALFDLDGTLFDSMGVWAHVDEVFFARRGMAVPAEYGCSIAGLSFHQVAEYTRKRFNLAESVEEIMAEWDEICLDAYTNEVQLKPDALAYLKRLKAAGVRLAVATTLPPHLYTPVLKRTGAFDLFDAFATTHETGNNKASGEIYRLAARRLGVDPADCVVFEDIVNGLIGARAAGMRAYCVRDDAAISEQAEAMQLCDRYVDSFSQLLKEEDI